MCIHLIQQQNQNEEVEVLPSNQIEEPNQVIVLSTNQNEEVAEVLPTSEVAEVPPTISHTVSDDLYPSGEQPLSSIQLSQLKIGRKQMIGNFIDTGELPDGIQNNPPCNIPPPIPLPLVSD